MALKAFTAKLDEKMLKALKDISERTRIPQSELLREGIALVLRRHSEDAITPKLKEEIENILQEDSSLLKRLAKA